MSFTARSSSTAKKPVVAAQNRGRCSKKNPFVLKWCVSTTPLEPISRANAHFRVSPHPSPLRGWASLSPWALMARVSSLFVCFVPPPTSVGFMARTAGVLTGCARQKPPSRSRDLRVHTRTGWFSRIVRFASAFACSECARVLQCRRVVMNTS